MDQYFKLGLAALVVVAVVITLWPKAGPTALAGPNVATADTTPGAAPLAPAPGVRTPAAPAIGNSVETPDPTLAVRADALLLERVLASDSMQEVTRLGNDMLTRGDATNAVRLFRRAIELDPDGEANYLNVGIALGRMQKTDEAIVALNTALEIYPNFAEAHNSLGLQLAVKGQLGEARKHYEAALAILPDLAVAENNLGTIFARERQYEAALLHFDKAFQLDTNFSDARFNSANALLRLGQTNEATGRLYDLLNQQPDYEPAQILILKLRSAGER